MAFPTNSNLGVYLNWEKLMTYKYVVRLKLLREKLCRDHTLFELDQNDEVCDRGGDHAGQGGPL